MGDEIVAGTNEHALVREESTAAGPGGSIEELERCPKTDTYRLDDRPNGYCASYLI